ncbi:MAG: hypothetical protein HQL91_00735 [Magnetococcales bacterium]|nr:hypothetical protein [Magnetococcales bacterium]
MREFQAMSERDGGAARVGKGLLDAARELFDLWHGFRDEKWGRGV